MTDKFDPRDGAAIKRMDRHRLEWMLRGALRDIDALKHENAKLREAMLGGPELEAELTRRIPLYGKTEGKLTKQGRVA